jgi:hypothetical protein
MNGMKVEHICRTLSDDFENTVNSVQIRNEFELNGIHENHSQIEKQF